MKVETWSLLWRALKSPTGCVTWNLLCPIKTGFFILHYQLWQDKVWKSMNNPYQTALLYYNTVRQNGQITPKASNFLLFVSFSSTVLLFKELLCFVLSFFQHFPSVFERLNHMTAFFLSLYAHYNSRLETFFILFTKLRLVHIISASPFHVCKCFIDKPKTRDSMNI